MQLAIRPCAGGIREVGSSRISGSAQVRQATDGARLVGDVVVIVGEDLAARASLFGSRKQQATNSTAKMARCFMSVPPLGR